MMVRRASHKETLKTHISQMLFVWFCLNIIGESVGFFKSSDWVLFVFWVFVCLFFGVLFLLFHSIFDQSFSFSSLLWKIVTLT